MKRSRLVRTATVAAAILSAASPVAAYAAPATEQVAEVETEEREQLTAEDIEALKSVFDAKFFASKYPEVAAVLGGDEEALFNYFCAYGIYRGEQPSASFNVAAYAAAYADLRNAFGTDIVAYYKHYAQHGAAEGRTLCTAEACEAAGISVRESEREMFGISTPVAPVQSKAAETPAPAEEPSAEEEHGYEPAAESEEQQSSAGFNKAAYDRDMLDWQLNAPSFENYMTEEGKEAWLDAIEKHENGRPEVSDFVVGSVYPTAEEAAAAYASALSDWQSAAPSVENYTEPEYEAAMAEYEESNPEPQQSEYCTAGEGAVIISGEDVPYDRVSQIAEYTDGSRDYYISREDADDVEEIREAATATHEMLSPLPEASYFENEDMQSALDEFNEDTAAHEELRPDEESYENGGEGDYEGCPEYPSAE